MAGSTRTGSAGRRRDDVAAKACPRNDARTALLGALLVWSALMTTLARPRPYLRTGAVVATAAVAYYLLAVRRRPVLRYGKTQLNERVVQRLAHIFQAPYTPPLWAFHPWLQLLVVLSRMKRAPKKTPFTRTTLTAPDGGTIALDVLEDVALPPSAPVLLILPTITGCLATTSTWRRAPAPRGGGRWSASGVATWGRR